MKRIQLIHETVEPVKIKLEVQSLVALLVQMILEYGSASTIVVTIYASELLCSLVGIVCF